MRAHRSAPLLATLAVLVASAALVACTDDAELGLPTEVPVSGPTTTAVNNYDSPPCNGEPGVGGSVPDGAQAGDLISSRSLEPSHGSTDGYPTGATVHRILYVSTGVDESDLQLVCGLAAVPDSGPARDENGTGHMLAWAHGTIGLQQKCLPSNAPELAFWAQMSSGIGAIGWGSGRGARKGQAVDGALQHVLDQGWVVSATDYQPDDTYVIGKIAAANVVDAARAATQLVQQEFGEATPSSYDTIAWGHSQGGHAALWAGQLFETYQAGVPNDDAVELHLRGVAAEAPASNLIAQPELQPGLEYGDGLADWEMHEFIQLLPISLSLFEVQFGAALFSYIFGSWTSFSHLSTPSPDAEFPAYPLEAADLDLSVAATETGSTTIAQVMALCVAGPEGKTVKQLTSKYHDAASNRMLTEDLWNLPDDYRPGQYFKGGTDRTCGTTTDPEMEKWCTWIRWNIPGPTGVHPFPTHPSVDGKPVPVLIAQGMDDDVIHCQVPDGGDASVVPAASDCMSTALFDALSADAYCPASGDEGYLRLSLFRPDGAASPATHLSIPGQIAAKGSSTSAADLSFVGSPLERFFTEAMAGTLGVGCRAEVMNPA
jgi:hypothetical protein